MHIYYDDANIIPLILELVEKGNTKTPRHQCSNVHVFHGRGEQEGKNLAPYLNIKFMQITCNKLQYCRWLLGICMSAISN